MQLSVIIVSYNVKYYLEQCLYSVTASCKFIDAEIIVVDNASDDKTIYYLQPRFPQVRFIQNPENEGFAKANNIALKQAAGKYILYLNPDTIVAEDTLANCISFLNEHEKAGAAGIKMIDGSGNFLPESKRAFPSVTASFFKLSGMAALFPKSPAFNKYALGNLDENKVHEAAVLAGAFLLSRKQILIELNGFDEKFFMYGEDIDLSYRILKSGYKNYYLGNNVILHFKGESTNNEAAYSKNFYGAMKTFVHKHYKNKSSALLKASITAAAFISTSAKKVNSLFISSKKENAVKDFILVGDKEATASATTILQANNYTAQVLLIPYDAFKNFETFLLNHELVKRSMQRTGIVFCLNKLTFHACIQFMQRHHHKHTYYFHYKGSGSIVSGSSRNTLPQIYIDM